ncbi:hypothetical protein Acr_21g0008070 [Actinidia rufa]|uniref:Glycine-rich protein n=1 Tax=Actinidia rufa TaxID=165716 RepID=A0A7J0GHK3_9ERIC|nr:hypothetical protein Acr_21g0008070 [Actinidia rufa]
MAPSLKFVTLLVFLLLGSSSFFMIQARPLNVAKPRSSIGEAIENLFEGFYIGTVKTGGPSPGGKGHEFTDTETLAGIKNSGRSSGGNGHDFTNALTLGGIKNSGPSPGGEGHEFTDAQTLGGIKNSGPSSGGNGHDFTNALTLGVSKTLVQAREERDTSLLMLKLFVPDREITSPMLKLLEESRTMIQALEERDITSPVLKLLKESKTLVQVPDREITSLMLKLLEGSKTRVQVLGREITSPVLKLLESGPRAGGEGQHFTDDESALGEIKHSGPSPGQGN